jgi:AAT family amino acid transporter
VKLIVGAQTVDQLGSTITQFPAQLGVCWVFWMVFWANAFGNRPTTLEAGANYLVRVAITLGLAIGTFVLYYYVVAGTVLHEPSVAGGLYGNALGWMDWMILWTLFYVVCLGSFGIPAEPEVSADEPEALEEVFTQRSSPSGDSRT